MHCVLRDALLHTTVVMCAYLPYCHLPVSFDQFVRSHVSALRTAAHWMFLFFCTILYKLYRLLCVKIPGSAVSQTTLSGTNNQSHLDYFPSPF